MAQQSGAVSPPRKAHIAQQQAKFGHNVLTFSQLMAFAGVLCGIDEFSTTFGHCTPASDRSRGASVRAPVKFCLAVTSFFGRMKEVT